MILAPEFAHAFEGKVRRKKNITGNIRYQSVREKARRLSGYSPEVMVRITSYGKGAGNAWRNLGYISRLTVGDKEELELETDRGEILLGEAIKDYARAWEQDFGKPNKRRRDTVRMILSMPEGTVPDAVKTATREFASKTFSANHEYVFVLHTDEPHPHCHLTVKMLGHDGTRLDPDRDDLADWRELFAQALRDVGVDAEATRREARGVILKPARPVVQQIKNDKRVPKVEVLAELDAIAILKAEQQGVTVAPGPWEPMIETAQQRVRSAWLALAEQLGRAPVKLVFTPAVHHDRLQRAQEAGAAYQVDLAAPRAGEAPRPVARRLPAQKQQPATSVVPLASAIRLADIISTSAGVDAGRSAPIFNQEIHHGRTGSTQQHGAVYQSNLRAAEGGPPHAVANLRELPGLDVVRHRPAQVLLQPDARHRLGKGAGTGDGVRRSGVGLAGDRASAGRGSAAPGRQGPAQDRPQAGVEGGGERNPAGQGAGASDGRVGAGPAGSLARLKRLGDLPTTHASDKVLAADIRAFVAAMPAVETQRDIIKRRLAAQFPAKAAPMQTIPGQATPAQNAGRQKGAEPAAPSGIDVGP